MISTFLKYVRFEKRYSANTVLSYKTDLLQFERFIKDQFDLSPEKADFGMVRSWIIQLSEAGLEAPSINRKIASLRSFFKFLARQEKVAKGPLDRVKPLKAKRKLPHFVKEGEMLTTLDPARFSPSHQGRRDQLILELLYGTGMRLSELIHLKESSVNLDDHSVKVLGKRNKERVIPFPESIVSIVKAYVGARNREVEKKDHGYLLVTDGGNKMYPAMVYRIVKKYLGETSVEKKSPHVLRHTYATHLLNKGAEINAVKDLLGHSSLAATQVYTHNTIEKLKKVFDQAHPKA